MSKKFSLFILSLVSVALVVAATSTAFAQRGKITEYASPLDPSAKPTPIYVGPAGGINILGHSLEVRTFSDDVQCPTFTNPNGLGFYGGFTFEYLLGKDPSISNSSIIVRALYNTYPGNTKEDGDRYPSANPSTNEIVYSSTEHDLDIKCDAVTLEVMYKFNPIPGFGLGVVAGPAIDYILTKTWKQRYMLVGDPLHVQFVKSPKYTYEDNDRTAVIRDEDIPDASSIRLGLKAGVQYEILLGSKFYVVPSLSYNFGITSFLSEHNWRISPLQIGLDARYAFAL